MAPSASGCSWPVVPWSILYDEACAAICQMCAKVPWQMKYDIHLVVDCFSRHFLIVEEYINRHVGGCL